MRLASTPLALIASVFVVACSATAEESAPPPDEPEVFAPSPPPKKEKAAVLPPEPEKKTPATGTFAEVVYVLMRDSKHGRWFCTGTLVAKDKVVTAAHCLDPEEFVSYEIVAPLAPDQPRVTASNPHLFGGSYNDVANPDIGFISLDTPIELPLYGTLTDVVARVEGGEKLLGAAMVRTKEEIEAPLAMSAQLPLSSTVPFGYEYGFGTPYFSHGGDSGAGLFLVEDGQVTHKLIAVARQPEPDRELDHFTRVGAAFLEWYAKTKDN